MGKNMDSENTEAQNEESGTDNQQRNETVSRDDLPAEVYAAHTDYVKLAMKTMTAKRMIGWLRAFADHCEIAGKTASAEHARVVANRLAEEVEPDKVDSLADGEDDDDDFIPQQEIVQQ